MRFLTNAPAAYDYGYTVEVGTDTWIPYEGHAGTPCRVVEIPEAHASYQTARYGSGLYFSVLDGNLRDETEAQRAIRVQKLQYDILKAKGLL